MRNQDRTTIPEAFRTVLNAAELAKHCDNYWRDQRDRADGWSIHYAVDVDVIKLYSDPDEMSDYAKVFHNTSDQVTAQLADILGIYIFHRLSGAGNDKLGSLLLIPTHDEEYEGVKNAIVKDVLSQSEAAAKAMAEVVNELMAGRTDSSSAEAWQAAVTRLVEQYPHVVEAYDGLSGVRKELSRLAALPRGRLLSLTRSPVFNSDAAKKSFLPRLNGREAPDRKMFLSLVVDWHHRLDLRGNNKKNLDTDTRAMAMLQWINARMADAKVRLVLISGTRRLFDAAATVPVGTVGTLPTTFDRLYLRDPRAFLGATDFFKPNSVAAKLGDAERFHLRMEDWLNLFFPSVLMHHGAQLKEKNQSAVPIRDATVHVNTEALDKIVEQNDPWVMASIAKMAGAEYTQRSGKKFPSGLLLEWKEQIQTTSVLMGKNANNEDLRFRSDEFLSALNNHLESKYTLKDFEDELQSRIDQSLEGLYLETGGLGVLQLLKEGDAVRGVPALRFDTEWAIAQTLTEELCSALWKNDSNFDLGQTYMQLATHDPENYHAQLIHAQVYAANGHWAATRTLCRLALGVAERLPEDQKCGRRGREAAYLLAIAERRLAKKVDDLERARAALRKAEDLESPDKTSTDVRFLAESLAQTVTGIQFVRFGEQPTILEYDVSCVISKAQEILKRVTSDDPKSVQNWVHRQVITNALIVALLATADGINPPSNAQQKILVGMLDVLYAEHLAPDSDLGKKGVLFVDSVSSFIYSVATVAWHSDSVRKKRASDYLTSSAGAGFGVFSFEKKREELLRQFIGRLA